MEERDDGAARGASEPEASTRGSELARTDSKAIKAEKTHGPASLDGGPSTVSIDIGQGDPKLLTRKWSVRSLNPVAGLKWFAENNIVTKIWRQVGWRFVFVTCALYGFDQGGIENLQYLAGTFLFKDRGYESYDTERALAWADFSWEVKTIFGAIMDTLPVFGFHFRPYIIPLGFIGTASYSAIWARGLDLSYVALILCMFFGMNAVVWSDIALDGKFHAHRAPVLCVCVCVSA